MGAGITAHEFEHGLCNGFEQSCGQAGGQWDSEAIAIARGIFGGHETAFPGNAQFEQTAGTDEPVY
jgi:hypothetical protein